MFVLFHGLLYYLLEKRKKNRGQRGPNLTQPPHIMRIIQYKTLRSEFVVIYISYILLV